MSTSLKTFQGSEVVWETLGYDEEFTVAQKSGGIFDLSSWGTVKISGPDAKDYLQRMSTVDVKSMSPGEVRHGAFLTGKGTVVSLGMLFFHEDAYYYLVSPGQASTAYEHIEKFHFAENLTAEDVSSQWALLGEWCPEPTAAKPALRTEQLGMTLQWRDDSRPNLKWIWAPRADFSNLLGQVIRTGTQALGYHLFEYFRVAAGVPQMNSELTSKEIILEGNFDQAVARNKGCYPGQEVAERIFTYGQVNKKLWRVYLECAGLEGNEIEGQSLPLAFDADGKSPASLVGAFRVPGSRTRGVGLAFVHKNYWEFHDKFKSSNATMTLSLKRA